VQVKTTIPGSGVQQPKPQARTIPLTFSVGLATSQPRGGCQLDRFYIVLYCKQIGWHSASTRAEIAYLWRDSGINKAQLSSR